MPYIFGKLWHLALIWAIRKAFQCILQGVRILLANHTRISPTSDNESYIAALRFFNLLGFATGIKDLKRNLLNVKLKLLTITLVFGKILTNQRPWFILIDQSEVRIVSKFFLCKNWESARIECKFLAAALPRVKTTPSMELSQPPWPSYKYT